MAKNKLQDLNNHLFAQLERLGDEELTEEQIKKETQRAKAISGLASNIINNARTTIEAMKLVDSGNYTLGEIPKLFGIENKSSQ